MDYRCSGENNGTEQLKFSLTIGLHGILARKRDEKKEEGEIKKGKLSAAGQNAVQIEHRH